MNLRQLLNFFGGLLGGFAVGAAVVMLLAPNSGTETRQLISAKYREIVDAGQRAADERRRMLRQEYEAAIRIPVPLDEPQEN
jgi:gas vesicle protein